MLLRGAMHIKDTIITVDGHRFSTKFYEQVKSAISTVTKHYNEAWSIAAKEQRNATTIGKKSIDPTENPLVIKAAEKSRMVSRYIKRITGFDFYFDNFVRKI